MRQVRVHGPHDVRVDDVAPPAPGSGDVVVRVAACGICGTDLGYIAHGGLAGPGPEPMALGHEISGVIDWVGADVAGIERGDRVVVHPGNDELGRIGNGAQEGGLAPELLVRDARLGTRVFAVPGGMPLDIAALTEPLDVGMHAGQPRRAHLHRIVPALYETKPSTPGTRHRERRRHRLRNRRPTRSTTNHRHRPRRARLLPSTRPTSHRNQPRLRALPLAH